MPPGGTPGSGKNFNVHAKGFIPPKKNFKHPTSTPATSPALAVKADGPSVVFPPGYIPPHLRTPTNTKGANSKDDSKIQVTETKSNVNGLGISTDEDIVVNIEEERNDNSNFSDATGASGIGETKTVNSEPFDKAVPGNEIVTSVEDVSRVEEAEESIITTQIFNNSNEENNFATTLDNISNSSEAFDPEINDHNDTPGDNSVTKEETSNHGDNPTVPESVETSQSVEDMSKYVMIPREASEDNADKSGTTDSDTPANQTGFTNTTRSAKNISSDKEDYSDYEDDPIPELGLNPTKEERLAVENSRLRKTIATLGGIVSAFQFKRDDWIVRESELVKELNQARTNLTASEKRWDDLVAIINRSPA